MTGCADRHGGRGVLGVRGGQVAAALPQRLPADHVAARSGGPGADRAGQVVRRVVAGPRGRRPGGLRARDPAQGVPLRPPAAEQLASCRPTEARGRAAHDDDRTERLACWPRSASSGDLDRAVVVLRYWEDRSVAETAAMLGLSVAAVRNRSLRALRSLRGLLGEDALSGQTNGSGS